ncbi:hypothetical protein GN244_ATG12597 [Phytophthora infestans]|uniref:Uncharacterized protein n=1 Tax=Phytophthora infestans TaxID=4787 RepID=A0A833SQ11_PHYIN|nr:hypothetical protein GN244_ATG12597 [Phytophthora infestans]
MYDVSVRVTKAMGALKEVKKRREVTSNVMLYVSLLEEIVEYGVMLLELEADERSEAPEDAEAKPVYTRAEDTVGSCKHYGG